jgi:hypothetical protein
LGEDKLLERTVPEDGDVDHLTIFNGFLAAQKEEIRQRDNTITALQTRNRELEVALEDVKFAFDILTQSRELFEADIRGQCAEERTTLQTQLQMEITLLHLRMNKTEELLNQVQLRDRALTKSLCRIDDGNLTIPPPAVGTNFWRETGQKFLRAFKKINTAHVRQSRLPSSRGLT